MYQVHCYTCRFCSAATVLLLYLRNQRRVSVTLQCIGLGQNGMKIIKILDGVSCPSSPEHS